MTDPTRAAVGPAPPATPSLADPAATTDTGGGGTVAVMHATTGGRYVLGTEIARGGMGAVYRATDTVLGREVAVKVLGERFAPDSSSARRFADEARITGQLQHPGIPPVHDLGTLPDGRPFLAMKLIKGETLDEQLRLRPHPAADRGRWVAAFEQVCHALGYAHAHGVIHRDLKPGNVMVGSHGEVQVMDWGLAKLLTARDTTPTPDPDETAAGTEIRSLRDGSGPLTQAGSVLGTPAFMPPEQAAGAVSKTDMRSDVFGLGAVLAVILTGKPPFAAGSVETTRVKAAQGDVAECFARLDGCGAEPELVALCKRCLSPKPADRPADAGVVARAVAELRQAADERARQAELDVVKAAERRKRRRVQLALATVVVLLTAVGGGFALWWEQQRRTADERVQGLQQRAFDAEVSGDLARAAALFGEVETLAADPRFAAYRPEAARRRDELDRLDRFRKASRDTLRDGVHNIRSTREPADRRTERCQEALAVYGLADPDFDPDNLPAAADERRYRDEVLTTGRELLVLLAIRLAMFDTKDEQGKANTRRALGLLDRAAALPRLAGTGAEPSESTVGELMLRMLWHRRLGENAEADAAGDRMTALAKAEGGLRTAFDYYVFGSVTLNVVKNPKSALAAYQKALKLQPDHFGAHFGSFLCYQELKDDLGQLLHLTACLVFRPNDPDLYYFRGMVSFAIGDKFGTQIFKQIGGYDAAYHDFDAAVMHDPTYVKGYFYRGRMLVVSGKWKEAEADFTRAIDLDAKLVQAVSWRGIARAKTGRAAEAVADADRATVAEPTDRTTLFYAARACAQAAGAEKDAATANGYGAKSVQYLRRALEAGFTDTARTGAGSDFDPVRGREDFKKLMADPPKPK